MTEKAQEKKKSSIFNYGDQSVPGIFYKYRTWSSLDSNGNRVPNAQHQRILKACEIYFASALDLNDPSEGRNPLRYDRLSQRERLQMLEMHVKQMFPRMRKHEVCNYARHIESKRHWGNKNKIAEIQNAALLRVGVFSASEIKDKLVLWTYYADSHKGFCVGYDANIFDHYCRAIVRHLPRDKTPMITAYPMGYAHEKPVLIPRRWEDKVIGSLLTKSEDYAHEKEVRFFDLNGARRSMSLPSQAIKEVILGCKISEQDESEITELVQKKMPHVQIFKAKMRDDSFKLTFEEQKGNV